MASEELGVTSNVDLLRIGHRLGLRNLQVLSKDRLPRQPRPGLYIINMENEYDDRVGHWVCCAVLRGQRLSYYADPFGVVPPVEILQFPRLFRRPIAMSAVDIQALTSDKCGYFCLYILKGLASGRDFMSILDDFDMDEQEKNDKVIERFFSRFGIRRHAAQRVPRVHQEEHEGKEI
jgi:hypothetical protein